MSPTVPGRNRYDDVLDEERDTVASPARVPREGLLPARPQGKGATADSGSAPGNPYDTLLDQEDASRATALRQSLAAALQANPDEHAKALDLSARVGLPPSTVASDLGAAGRAAASLELPMALSHTPVLREWMQHPDNAAVAHDDVPGLSKLERLFGSWRLRGGDPITASGEPLVSQTRPGAIQDAIAAGTAQTQLAQAMLANLGKDPDAIPGIAGLREAAYRQPDTAGLGFVGRSMVNTAQIVPGLLYGATEGIKGALSGGGAAALAGGEGPQGAITVPIAAAAGGIAGGAKGTYDLETGLAYDEIVRQLKDRGLPVDYGMASAYAQRIGVANAVIEVAPLSVFSKIAGVRKLTGRLRSAAVSKFLSRPGVLRALTGGVVSAVEQIGTESVAEGLQQAVTSTGREAATAKAGGQADYGRVAGEAVDETVGALESFWLLAIPGAAGETMGGLHDTAKARLQAETATKSAETVQALVDAAGESKLAARRPAALADLAGKLAATGGAPADVYVSSEAWSTLWQAKNEDPAAKAEEILGQGGAQAYQEAKATGGDLSVPIGTYLSRLREEHEALKEDLRTAPGELTPREAGKVAEKADAELETAAKKAAKGEEAGAAPEQQVSDAIAAQLQAAGEAPDVASRQATVWGAFFKSLAERTGGDPLKLFQEYDVSVGRGEAAEPPSLAQRVVSLFQRRQEVPQGTIRFQKGGRAFDIRLLEGKDRSTFLHESAHFFLESYADIAYSDRAPDQIRQDYETVLASFGVRSREEITAEHHERFARSFEQYLLEGKAPSKELTAVFARFAAWLRGVYERTKGVIGSALTPEIRGVFNRMLATDEQIAAAEADQNYAPMFATPEEAGVSPSEHAAYVEQAAAATEAARASLLKELTDDKKRELEPWWKEAKADVRKEVEAELAADPVYRALHLLRTGVMLDGSPVPELLAGLKLSTDGVASIKGEPYLNLVRGITSEAGMDPDAAAPLLGFESGERMLGSFAEAPTYKAKLADTVRERMAERYGDIMANLPTAALAAVHSDARAKVLFKELRFLARRLGVPLELDGKALQAKAEEIVAGRRAEEMGTAAQQYRYAELRAAKRAGEAKGDPVQAYIAKQEQLFSFYLHQEAVAAKERKAMADRLFTKLLRQPSQERLAKAGEGYRDQLDRLLRRFGIPAPETFPDETFPEWLLQRTLAQERIEVADWLRDESRTAPYGRLTNAELADLVTASRNLSALASNANVVNLENDKIERVALLSLIDQEAAKNPDRGPEPASLTAAPKSFEGRARRTATLAALVDPEEIFRRLGETASRFFWGGYLKGRTIEDKLSARILEPLAKAWESLPAEMQKRRYELVDVPELPIPAQLNLGGPVDRLWLWMVALNAGNDSNFERLTGGYGWDPDTVLRVLDEKLSKQEWDFVQSVWDLMDKELWPDLMAKEQRKNGLPPEKIPARAVVTRHGTYPGGYFPARYDRRASKLGARQESQALLAMNGPDYLRPTTIKTHAHKRAARYQDVVNLNWHVVPSHVSQVVHDIAFDEYLRDAGQVAFTREFQTTVRRRLGEAYLDQIGGFLQFAASSQADAVPKAVEGIIRPLVGLRSRFVLSSLGWSLSVAGGDLTNPAIAVANGDVKTRSMIPALVRSVSGFRSMRSEAMAASIELPHRANAFAQRMRMEMGQIGLAGKREGILEGVRQTAWIFTDALDRVAATIIWDAAHREAVANGKSERDAARHADHIVSNNLPANDLVERPAILRDQRGVGALLAFYGYFSKLSNIVGRDWYETGLVLHDETKGVTTKAARAAQFAGRFLAVMFVSGVVAEFLSGRGPEDDEPEGEWLLRKMLAAPFSLIPFVGGAADAMASKLVGGQVREVSLRQAPATAALQRVWDALAKMADSDKDGSDRAWAALETIGVAAKLPVSQPARTGRYATRLATGEAEPRNPLDVGSGLVYGERQGQPRNPLNVAADAVEGE